MRNRLFFGLIAWIAAAPVLMGQPLPAPIDMKLPAPPVADAKPPAPVVVDPKLPALNLELPALPSLPGPPAAPMPAPVVAPPKEYAIPTGPPAAPTPVVPPLKEYSIRPGPPPAPMPSVAPLPVPDVVPPLKEFPVPNFRPAPPLKPDERPAAPEYLTPPAPLADGPQPTFRPASNAAPKVKPRSTNTVVSKSISDSQPPPSSTLPEFGDPNPRGGYSGGIQVVETYAGLAVPCPTNGTRYWARAEYLMWWVKDAPLGISLVTTGNPNNNPGAELLSSDRNFGVFSGMRLSMGAWCDTDNVCGLESSWFFLGRRSNDFFAASDNTGVPLLALPFISNAPGAPGAFVLPVSSPGVASGNVMVGSTLSMWGTEFNGAFTLYHRDNFDFVALVGFRYANLMESLSVTSVTSDLATNTVSILSDSFNTRNQFYGGQIAGRFNWTGDAVSLDITGKLALGSTHNTVDVQGISSQFGPNPPNGVFPGGFFAQPTNSGRFTGNRFSVMPSVETKLNFFLTPHIRTFVGYDFIYWNNVVRPGNQVDRTLNLTQSTILGGGGTLTGPASPGPMFNRTDFWTHGISFGLEVRF